MANDTAATAFDYRGYEKLPRRRESFRKGKGFGGETTGGRTHPERGIEKA